MHIKNTMILIKERIKVGRKNTNIRVNTTKNIRIKSGEVEVNQENIILDLLAHQKATKIKIIKKMKNRIKHPRFRMAVKVHTRSK